MTPATLVAKELAWSIPCHADLHDVLMRWILQVQGAGLESRVCDCPMDLLICRSQPFCPQTIYNLGSNLFGDLSYQVMWELIRSA